MDQLNTLAGERTERTDGQTDRKFKDDNKICDAIWAEDFNEYN